MTTENTQDALIVVAMPQKSSALLETATKHIERLRDAGRLTDLDEVTAQLLITLAGVATNTTKGYAAAQVLREFRETMALLPSLEDATSSETRDDLAVALDAVQAMPEFDE